MSVQLDPAQQLSFQRPLTSLIKRSLSISNPNKEPVAFKVKTTAPKLYCVRPNSGRIEPNDTVDVLVMLLPMKEDPPLSTKCKDKFLVQSTLISPEKDHLPLAEIWTQQPGEEPVHVVQQKLKVAWLASEGLPSTEEADESEYPSVLSNGDDSRYDTVRQAPPSINAPEEHEALPIRTVSPAAHFHDSAEEPAPPPAIAVHTPPHTPPPQPQPDSTAQLAEAHAEIQRLRALLASIPEPTAELRRRKGLDTATKDAEKEEGGAFVEQGLNDGYSPQQVAIIAFLVFLLTYLFF
ncbi:VAMP-associated protein [Exidia glandulosa HHB12029]|uniref:VAMP-associated protein n=1 Tax=Exidia glandulosa HHB12029 TaxID=1314781 RepID=A0A165P1T0_EXIGL|nr:VAMP-associated protein [Exidia glandulosa HHB12029]